MSIRAQDVVPISEARARLTELADDVVGGAEKVLTKNGAAFVAIVDARKLDYYHELEARERTRVFTLGDLAAGLEDAAAGRVQSLEQLRESMKTRHARLRSRAKG
ncbi:type II toxin-antitoxin system Phd/YefM family antitoxin [Paraburkholderia sp. UYCP14C]|uniref:type II toxin-antitoxin system prevent-host-death family antitoxin n=1 Tax=Paraburkholderia sp. UYCP14C TaxID=2511130 RepID=UPI00101F0100|nr:type II toxin-antitoxin system prevent-host-death family antitoxin [Paraburkholderia sp. UYCP14C]RZF24256.1 type II toxin-antitoxin system Phd/YefM family antitoxin [Paraburkholderia sp. UYCP14C]